MTFETLENKALNFIRKLSDALEQKNKQVILALYDEAKQIDWDEVPNYIFEDYDKLVDMCNNLISS